MPPCRHAAARPSLYLLPADVEDEDDEAERMAAFDMEEEGYSGGEATAGTN